MMENKNITIITPFYPITHRRDLFEDTRAINYLIKDFPVSDNILIVHTFMHNFKVSWKVLLKNFVNIFIKKKFFLINKDNYGNDVLFFEFLLVIPTSLWRFKTLDNIFVSSLERYYNTKKISPNIGVIHFPTYYAKIKMKHRLFPKTTAIIHAFDIKNIKNRYNLEFWKEYFNSFDSIGFRSLVIKNEFESLVENNKPTFLCYSGIPEDYISNEINYNATYNLSSKINIIYAGRIDKNKNIDKSIRAIKKFDNKIDYLFKIIGEGPERNNLKKVVKSFKMTQKIEFTGKLSRKETFEMMKNSDIFIMISKKETLGLVYLEAIAAGCIIIATKGQGLDGVIINGINGFLTDCEDETAIYQTILKVINLSADEQMKIKENAKKTIQDFTDTNISKEYYNNICSTIAQRS